eukprot:1487753-Prymnesium_polylepis.1
MLLACSSAAALRLPVRSRSGLITCSTEGGEPKFNLYAVIAGLAVAGELVPAAGAALARLGLWDPPPLNTFTTIAK